VQQSQAETICAKLTHLQAVVKMMGSRRLQTEAKALKKTWGTELIRVRANETILLARRGKELAPFCSGPPRRRQLVRVPFCSGGSS